MGPLSNAAVLFPHHPAPPASVGGGLGPGATGTLSGHLHFVDPATTQGVEQLEELPRLLSDQGLYREAWGRLARSHLVPLGPHQPLPSAHTRC